MGVVPDQHPEYVKLVDWQSHRTSAHSDDNEPLVKKASV